MSEFNVAPHEAPQEQQYRIFTAASVAWARLLATLAPEEVLAAIGTMAAMDIGTKLLDPSDEEKALSYVRSIAARLLPEVRSMTAEHHKPGAH